MGYFLHILSREKTDDPTVKNRSKFWYYYYFQINIIGLTGSCDITSPPHIGHGMKHILCKHMYTVWTVLFIRSLTHTTEYCMSKLCHYRLRLGSNTSMRAKHTCLFIIYVLSHIICCLFTHTMKRISKDDNAPLLSLELDLSFISLCQSPNF